MPMMVINMTMTSGDSIEIQQCPVCNSDMNIIKSNGKYGVRCPCCEYDYGDFEHLEYMIGAWNALATVFPDSVRRIANSIQKGV